MSSLAEFLSGLESIDRPVLDRTGLEGRFDFDLHLSDSQINEALGHEHAIYAWASILSDIRQLGLKLNRARGVVEMLVVDRARKPSQN